MTVPLRAALYVRVSTARQAETDASIPDQRRQGEGYCTSRGYRLVETYVEPGASATNDRRPEFQRMIEAGISKPAPFDVVVVHSFSRFFRDHFELEFYVRKLARNAASSWSPSPRRWATNVPRKNLGDLACGPLRRRAGSDVDPDDISAINPYNREAIQQFKANGRDHE